MKKYRIQPAERSDLSLPYPFFVTEDGLVGRQDFWKGKPYKLIGFNGSSANKNVEPACGLEEFLQDPTLAVGKYPIFEHEDGEWYTYEDKIDSVKEVQQ